MVTTAVHLPGEAGIRRSACRPSQRDLEENSEVFLDYCLSLLCSDMFFLQSLFICLPTISYFTWKHVIGTLFYDVMLIALPCDIISVGDMEHHEHKYVPWSHLRIRTKVWKHRNLTQHGIYLVTYHFILQPFPWGDGDASLFHNPTTNPRPDGEPAKVASLDWGPASPITSLLPSLTGAFILSLLHPEGGIFMDRVSS